mmetsp:Transcript_19593/g.28988  ORF Transcript_19593/g.28988 Transcript_19593/m.28988 type:complete len:85 (-) Transcript_19593:988-1242(-)
MKADSTKDQWDIKKFKEVVGESRMMIPDSKRRLQLALEDLAVIVEEAENVTEWTTKAKAVLTSQGFQLEQDVEETQVDTNDKEF